MFPLRFNAKLFLWLTLAFILFSVIGTLSYSLGHLAVAKTLGLKIHLGYSYIAIYCESARVRTLGGFLYSMAGPVQVILTGTIGLVILLIRRSRFRTGSDLKPGQWFLILITLFWLRPAAMLIAGIPFFIKGRRVPAPEIFIAGLLHWPAYSIYFSTGILGLIVFFLVLLRFIPPAQRITFSAGGLIGGMLGYWLWFIKFGPVLMP